MPKGWKSTDIGAPVTAGTADYSTGSKSFYLDGVESNVLLALD